MKSTSLIIFFFCMIYNHYTVGQCCSGGAPITGSLSTGSTDVKQLIFNPSFDYNRLNHLYEENNNLDENNRKRTTYSYLIEASYGFTKRISISSLFTYVNQNRNIETLSGNYSNTHTFGVGDLLLLGKYALFESSERVSGHLGLGTKLPTGSFKRKNDFGVILPLDLQPGTGTIDYLFWSDIQVNRIIRPSTNLTFSGIYRHSGVNKTYFNYGTYSIGNEGILNLLISDRFLVKGILFDPTVGLKFRSISSDKAEKNPFPNTGGSFTHLLLGVGIPFTENISWKILFNQPVYRRVKGTQLATSYRLTTGFSIRIKPKIKIK